MQNPAKTSSQILSTAYKYLLQSLEFLMEILGAINQRTSCYTLSSCGPELRSMTLVKRYLRWGLLGLIFLLTASTSMLYVVIDNDGDGDPATGTIVEFTIFSCREVQVSPSVVQAHSNRIARMPRMTRPANWLSEQLEQVRPAPLLSASSESFLTPLRC
jgi:hypothetical protein